MGDSQRTGRLLPAMLAAMLLGTAASPASIAAVYCNQMRTFLAHPCCGLDSDDSDDVTSTADLESATSDRTSARPRSLTVAPLWVAPPCCVSTRVALDRPAAEMAPKLDRSALPVAIALGLPAAIEPVPQLFSHERRAFAPIDVGPPIFEKVCSLLI